LEEGCRLYGFTGWRAALSHQVLTDQLLIGPGWLHISWNPFASPRHYVRIGYYK
jgi:hypothetical protein